MLDAATRARREALVAGHSGGTLLEVLALLIHGPVLGALSQHLRSGRGRGRGRGEWRFPLVMDAALLVVPLVLCVTVLSDWIVESLALWTATLLLTVLLGGITSSNSRSATLYSSPAVSSLNSYTLAARSFKGLNVLLVALCILAVDFSAFPRRFCKTEARGLALMDLGAATTIAAGGLLSRATTCPNARHSARSTAGWRGQDAVVVLLGLARWLGVRILNYQQPQSEYGCNWNFFFTIACVAACARALPPVGAASRGLLGAAIVVAHQAALSTTPLTAFILSADRSPAAALPRLSLELLSVWHSDREGLVSVLVMLAVLLLSQAAGALYCRRCSADEAAGFRAWPLMPPLLLMGLYAACRQLDPPSRRLGNAAHVAAVGAAVCAVLSAFLVLPLAADNGALLGLLSDHALVVFAAANALTGLVNVTLDTARVSDSQAVGLLCVYAGLLVATARLFERRAAVKY